MASTDEKELLFVHGFLKESASEYLAMDDAARKKALRNASAQQRKELLGLVDAELIESADGYFTHSGYPNSNAYQRIVWETSKSGVEEVYFWTFEHLRQDRAFHDIIKITDLYAASEASAFWGNQQQRISAQQNNAQGLLANIGKFVKELFQMVRELRIIDERLNMYESWERKDPETGRIVRSESADVTLKSLFTDQVEGGTKNPQSVFGLSQTVGFTLLPDLFFNTRVYNEEQLDKKIEAMDLNESNKNVLRRKLYQFLVWKEKTHKELETRREFNVRYLRQHWTIIKTYMNWAKPYLKNLKKLQMRQDLDEDPDLISSFDQNLAEIEILCKRKPKGKVYPVLLVNFQHRTRPDMNIRKEYQQGPTHLGRTQIQFRSYAWTEEEIKAYQRMRAREGIELLGVLDDQLAAVMDGLGEEFIEYLGEIESRYERDAPETPEPGIGAKTWGSLNDTLGPFTAIFGGFAELFGAFVPSISFGGKKDTGPSKSDREAAAETAKKQQHLVFHIFKKNRKMLTW